MEELEEILYEYRIGLRELPTYNELLELNTKIDKEIQKSYDVGFDDGEKIYIGI